MQPILENGKEKTNEAGTSFFVAETLPIFDAVESLRLEEELLSSKDSIQRLFATLKQDERKI